MAYHSGKGNLLLWHSTSLLNRQTEKLPFGEVMGEKIGNTEGTANGEGTGIELHLIHNSKKGI